jgi:quercetin dioxygenase-like cupin family protein
VTRTDETTPEVATVDELDGTPHAEVFEQPRPRAVRLRLAAGESVPPHAHPDSDVVIHVLSGELELGIDGENYDLSAGQVVRFSGRQEVSPAAVTDATALVVFASHPE